MIDEGLPIDSDLSLFFENRFYRHLQEAIETEEDLTSDLPGPAVFRILVIESNVKA